MSTISNTRSTSVREYSYLLAEGLCFGEKLAFELTVKNLNLAFFTGHKFHKFAKEIMAQVVSVYQQKDSASYSDICGFLYFGVCSLTERGRIYDMENYLSFFHKSSAQPFESKSTSVP